MPPSNEDTESEITPDQQSYDPHKPLMNIRSHFETKKIRDTEECGEEAHRYCSKAMLKNNFITLSCLQQVAQEKDKLSASCSNYLWNFKRTITMSAQTETAAKGACRDNLLKEHPECLDYPLGSGKLISCMLDFRQENYVGDTLLTPLDSIVYGDYTL